MKENKRPLISSFADFAENITNIIRQNVLIQYTITIVVAMTLSWLMFG